MSEIDRFWQYAREALLSVIHAKSEDDKQGLLELARIWTLAALQERQPSSNRSGPISR
jgi:hypothetical protein